MRPLDPIAFDPKVTFDIASHNGVRIARSECQPCNDAGHQDPRGENSAVCGTQGAFSRTFLVETVKGIGKSTSMHQIALKTGVPGP